ncbi:MAG: chromosomal replication initiator protein DnaA [Clostridia bacterium]|nr:chromosomal replication initiator protein DnaA [Clostridia bacterium]
MGAFFLDIEQLWKGTCDLLRNEMTKVTYDTWIASPLKPVTLNGDTLVLQAATVFFRDHVSGRYSATIESALSQTAGLPLHIRLVTQEEAERLTVKAEAPQPLAAFLNPKYTFDSFVVGRSNRFAHAACLAVADSPAQAYNPLFIYGGVGLGKTHLMHAIGHYMLAENPGMKITYVSSETFMNELISAIQTGQNAAFREKYRNVDALLIDDIQFIAGTTSTQEEFFHTFNTLHTAGKQIVISADRPPREIPRLEERLRSRFEWGLIADIQRPDLETRIAILRRRAQEEMIRCDDSVLQMIAERVESNIRELEGSLTRLAAYASLSGREISLSLAEEALHEVFAQHEPRTVTCEDVMGMVASFYSVTVDDLKGPRRTREITVPRQIAMYLCREMTDSSMSRIGDVMGGRDHTTVLHGCDKVAEDLRTSESLSALVDDIRHRLQNA